MLHFLIGFCVGGYLVPAAHGAIIIYDADRQAEDNPSVTDSLLGDCIHN